MTLHFIGQFNSGSVTINHWKLATAVDANDHARTISVGYVKSMFGASVSYTNYTLVNDKTIKQIVGDNALVHLKNLGIQASNEAEKQGK